MHVLQKIAVKADNKDMAFNKVKSWLESELGTDQYESNSWFDWFVTGGGRWNTNTDGYDDNDQSMTISYAEEPEKFVSAINEAVEYRIEEFNRYRKNFNDRNIDINACLDSYTGNTDYSFDLYDLNKMIDLMYGKWDFNSYFYDMHHASTNSKHVLDNLGDSWYLVFVDFHF